MLDLEKHPLLVTSQSEPVCVFFFDWLWFHTTPLLPFPHNRRPPHRREHGSCCRVDCGLDCSSRSRSALLLRMKAMLRSAATIVVVASVALGVSQERAASNNQHNLLATLAPAASPLHVVPVAAAPRLHSQLSRRADDGDADERSGGRSTPFKLSRPCFYFPCNFHGWHTPARPHFTSCLTPAPQADHAVRKLDSDAPMLASAPAS
jgi:hypothetical protein